MSDPSTRDADAVSAWRSRALVGRRGRPLLVCFPHAGGSAAFFAPWVAALSHAAHVVAVQYPGHGFRGATAPLSGMPELSLSVYREVAPLLEPPFAFFGHSLGALVAFEVARRCEREGRPGPSHLFASASPPPHGTRTRTRAGRIGDLPDAAFLDALAPYGEQTVASLRDPLLRSYAMPILRADIRVVECYVPPAPGTPGARLTCDLTVLGGRQDAGVPPAALRGWERWTSRGVRYVELEGDHFYLRERVQRDRIAAEVTRVLAPRPLECEL